jgi:hypothetical protein
MHKSGSKEWEGYVSHYGESWDALGWAMSIASMQLNKENPSPTTKSPAQARSETMGWMGHRILE